MSTTATSNVELAVRTQLEYYGAGRYDLAEQFVTNDYVDHEAPPGTPPGPKEPTQCCVGYEVPSTT